MADESCYQRNDTKRGITHSDECVRGSNEEATPRYQVEMNDLAFSHCEAELEAKAANADQTSN